MMTDPQGLDQYKAGKGTFDVHYECTGSPQALAVAIEVMRLRGVIMQRGLSGDMPVPMMAITAKELEIRGSFRFHEEFATAVSLMQSGDWWIKTVITHTFLSI